LTGVDPGLQFHGSDQSAASSDFIDNRGICFGQFVAPRFLSRIGGFQETVSDPTLTQQSRGPRLIAEQFCNILGCYLSRFLKQDVACRYNAVTDNMPLKSSVNAEEASASTTLTPNSVLGHPFTLNSAMASSRGCPTGALSSALEIAVPKGLVQPALKRRAANIRHVFG
jgi:hypothetical protein